MFAKDNDGLIKFENIRRTCDDIESFLPADNKHVTDEEISEMLKIVNKMDTERPINFEDFIAEFSSDRSFI